MRSFLKIKRKLFKLKLPIKAEIVVHRRIPLYGFDREHVKGGENIPVLRYPKDYEKTITLRDGVNVFLRPQLPTDTELLWTMFSTLSSESLRFLSRNYTRQLIESWTTNMNYDSVLPILAIFNNERVVASASLRFFPEPAFMHKAEFSIVVHDDFQNRGLGTALTEHMVNVARRKKLKKVYLRVTAVNKKAIHVYKKCGFQIEATLRKDRFYDNKFYDDYIMAIFL